MTRIERILRIIEEEAKANPAFMRRLETAMDQGSVPSEPRSGRRAPAAFDVLARYQQRGVDELRVELEKLNLEQLKDIVAEYGMDHSRLALKWRRPERLVDLICETVAARVTKGDAFR